jgi:PAS domain S-box-containing protein
MVGDVSWGTHFCYFYETKQDLLDILVPYFKAGLEGDEFCLWIVSNSDLITSEEAKAALGHAVPKLDQYLSAGRIEIVSHDQWWFLKSRTFDFKQVAHQFKEKLDDSLAAGYVGMRVNGSPAWMSLERHEELCRFEKEVDGLYPYLRIIAACTYPVGASTADLLFDVARSHRFTIARRRGKWDVLETPELLQAKQQIAQLNRELEQRVRERTKELETANEKLGEQIEERKRAEEQARKVLDTIPALIGSGASNGILDYCNQQWLAYAGVSLEELQKGETIHPDDMARVVRAWQEAMATGKPYELEQRHRRFDGVYRWFLARGVPLKDAEGVIERWYGTLTDIEDRKQAEEALVESRRKLKEAQRLANIGYWERDLLADRLILSEETAKIFGLSQREFTQAEMQAMVHPDDREQQERALEDALEGKRRYDNEYRVILPTGKLRFVHVSDEIIYDQSGHPLRMFGAVQDVTARKQAEQALRESQQLLQLMLATLPVGVAVTNQAGDIVLNNAASKRIWGRDLIVSGRERWAHSKGSWHDSGEKIAPADWASARALSHGQTSLNELIDIKTYDGQPKIIENSAAPIRNADGLIVGAVIVNEDVTERVETEEALRRSEENFRKTFESSPAPAAISRRRDRHVLNVNSAYVRTFGYTAEEAIGKTPDELGVWPDERERQEFLQRVQSETSVKGYETRLRTKSGALIDVLIYSQAIELSGEPCFLTSVIDITERVRAEEQLKTTSEQLRALSASLQTAREDESKRIAREIHDELGGALTSWRWDLEEIRDAISEPIDSSQVMSARMKIDAMIKLTETTLDTVRKLSSELRPMALELGLVEALEWQAIQFRERTGIQVDLISSVEKAGLENGAATAVFRILQESLTNIQRHAQATKILIAARQDAGNFILTIKDNGRGISDDDQSAPQSLGLLGMRERAHLVGGELNIEVAKGGGTEITVRIPLPDRELPGRD